MMADPENPLEIGSSIPGKVVKVLVKEGDAVEAGDTVAIVEAMKMETNVTASCSGLVEHVYVQADQMVEATELLLAMTECTA